MPLVYFEAQSMLMRTDDSFYVFKITQLKSLKDILTWLLKWRCSKRLNPVNRCSVVQHL